MGLVSRHLRSYHALHDCNNNEISPCDIIMMNARQTSTKNSNRALEEVVDIIQQPRDEESGVSGMTIFVVALSVVLLLGFGLMYYCAFQKHSDYDPEQAAQTRRGPPRRTVPRHDPGRPNSAAANNTPPPPPDPERPQKIAVNLYYGKVSQAGVGSEMGMKKMSSGRFTKQATTFEPRQPNADDECPICCDHFLPGQDYVISKVCNHVYHKSCIEQWTLTEQKDDCPVCRCVLLPSTDLPPPILPPNRRR